jgi:WS/DGAT/MGAT family acyltransferase
MEDPTNLMMITGVLVFGAPLEYDRLKATLERRLLPFDRFRLRIVHSGLPWGGFYWANDPEFDLAYHLQRATLPPPGDQVALQDTASLLASTPLDLSRPPWQIHLVEGYGDGCALICRLHHCIADGIALVHVLLSLTDSQPDTPWPVFEPEPQPPRRRASLGQVARATYTAAGRTARAVRHQCQDVRVHPSHAFDLVGLGARGTSALGRLVLRWPDPKTVFKGGLDVPKRAAWSQPIALEDVKEVGRGLEGTVNDVLLTAMAGALRRYLQGRGEPVDGLNFRAVVPVDLRRPGTEAELGNKFGLVFLSLPLGMADPADRLHELKRRMDDIKGSLEAPVAYGLLNTIGMLPQAIQALVIDIFGTKGTAVMTNVIGPKESLYLAGAPLESLMFWVPQSGHLGLGVSILSYAGRVWLGVITDEGLVPDPETIVTAFHVEFNELLTKAHGRNGMTTIKEMSAMLDDVLVTLDAILEEQQEAGPTPGEETQPTPSRCQALTVAGQPCKNKALPGSEFCRVHRGSRGAS